MNSTRKRTRSKRKKRSLFKLLLLPTILVLAVGTLIASFVNTKPKLAPGFRAPDLQLETQKGAQLALSDLQGNFTLLHFWASWCVPCEEANPKLRKLYEELNDEETSEQNFEIYSVSLDDSLESWQQAIERDSLQWNSHVSDLRGWNSRAAEIFNVKFLPTSYLIDESGVIVGKNLSLNEIRLRLQKGRI